MMVPLRLKKVDSTEATAEKVSLVTNSIREINQLSKYIKASPERPKEIIFRENQRLKGWLP